MQVNIIRDYSLREDIAAETGEDPKQITEVGRYGRCHIVVHEYHSGGWLCVMKRKPTGRAHGCTFPSLPWLITMDNQDRIGAAVIMCKDLENYTEQDWNVLLDKPELVFARAR